MSWQNHILSQGARVGRDIDPVRFQQPPASAECALADRIEDHVVFLIVLREVLGRVVDD